MSSGRDKRHLVAYEDVKVGTHYEFDPLNSPYDKHAGDKNVSQPVGEGKEEPGDTARPGDWECPKCKEN